MKKTLFILLTIVLSLNAENFNEYKKTELQQFNNYKNSLQNAFKAYKNALNKGFETYKKELSVYWKVPKLTTKKTYVAYSKDKTTREIVNYKNEQITINVIAKTPQQAKAKIKNALNDLSTKTTKQAFYQNPVLSTVTKVMTAKYKSLVAYTKPSNELVVGDMIFGGKPTKEKVSAFVNKSLQKPLKTSPSKIKNAKVYTLTIKLPPNSILIKAKKYRADVFKRAEQFALTPSLIYAIIHTESSFNPLARSYVPAFGLMQIVPQTAGADAYRMLYKRKKILSPSYLYNSHNNILIGSAYLNEIYYGYFKGVKNPLSRLFCTIAAYNTGAGNVACAFNSNEKDFRGKTVCRRSRGDYSISKALLKINSMSSKEVYNYLLKNLRYDEARNYLKRVTSRYLLYLHSMQSHRL